MYELLIKGALLGLEAPQRGDVAVSGGRIAAVSSSIEQPAREVIDARGMLLLPGGVDMLVGFDLNSRSQCSCDGWTAGTAAALAGGTTTAMVQLLPGESCPTPLLGYLLRNGLRQGRNAHCDYTLHAPAMPELSPTELRELPEQLLTAGVNSWMAELCGEYGISGEQLDALLEGASAMGAMTILRAEDNDTLAAVNQDMIRSGCLDPSFFARSRPAAAEVRAVQRILEQAHRHNDAPVLISGISCAESLSEICAARSRGQRRIFCATSPQYLLLDELEYYQGEERALRATCIPPLRRAENQNALWQGLEDGSIDMVQSDHRSFSLYSKRSGRSDLRRIPLGVPGIEERMTLILSEGVKRRRLSFPRALAVLCRRPASVSGMGRRKGVLRKGADADLVLFDPRPQQRFSDTRMHGECEYSLYGNLHLIGQVKRVWLCGKNAFSDNTISTELRGNFVPAASVFK